jgi:hypothetical protein
MKQKTFTYTFYYWGGGAFIRRLLSLVGLLSRALLSGDLCPGGFCPIPVIVIFPNDHQYFNIILRISDLVNVSGMVGLQKITTDYSSGPLIQCVKWVNNTVFFVINFNWCQTQKTEEYAIITVSEHRPIKLGKWTTSQTIELTCSGLFINYLG